MGSKSSLDEENFIVSTVPFLKMEDEQVIGLKRTISTRNAIPWVAHGIALLLLFSSSVRVLSLGRPSDLECARQQSTWCKREYIFQISGRH